MSPQAPTPKGDRIVEAASVCLYNPSQRQVLIGCRLREPLKNWWAFPGGRVHEHESAQDAARRELREETGIEIPTLVPFWKRVVFATGVGCTYRIENFGFTVLTSEEPVTTPEFRAVWTDLEAALEVRPMTPGTLQLLRELSDWHR